MKTSQGQLAPTGLESLGQQLELELGLGTGAGVASGPAVVSGLGLALGSTLGAGLDFGSGACVGEETQVPPLDPETKRRLSLQEPQTSLDSRTPQRHSSDPGGS